MTTVTRILVNDSLPFFVLNKTNGQNLDLWITDGKGKSYQGQLKEADIEKAAQVVDKSSNTYRTLLQIAFTNDGLSNEEHKFVYSLTESNGNVCLLWKQVITNDVKVILGSIPLKEVETSSLMIEIANVACARISYLQTTLKTMQKDQEALKTQRDAAHKTLTEFVAGKREMENELYSKFVLVLNTKKEKLKELKEQLNSCKKDPSSKDREIGIEDKICNEDDDSFDCATSPEESKPIIHVSRKRRTDAAELNDSDTEEEQEMPHMELSDSSDDLMDKL